VSDAKLKLFADDTNLFLHDSDLTKLFSKANIYLYLYLLLQPLKLGQVDLLAVHRPSNKYARIQIITTVFPVFV